MKNNYVIFTNIVNIFLYFFLLFIFILDSSLNNNIHGAFYLRLIFFFLCLFWISIICFRLRSKIIVSIISLLATLYFLLDFVLVIYYLERHFRLDFFFFWYNRADAIETLKRSNINFGWLVLILITSGIIFYLGLSNIIGKLGSFFQAKYRPQSIPLLVLIIISVLFLKLYNITEVYIFFKQTFSSKSNFEKAYLRVYQKSIDNNIDSKSSVNLNKFENNIFIFHLESINAELISKTITPSFLKISKDGILIPRIQASSVQTIRSQEVILCSILPSIHESFAFINDPSSLMCLPKILKQLGYTTFFFQSYPDLNFANTGNFMKKIGFDEVHSADIMDQNDTYLDWGYREDIFYKKVFSYLEKYKGTKIFVYTAVDSSNHYPFLLTDKQELFKGLNLQLPFKSPKSFNEQISNTTYIQDYFFGQMYEKLYSPYYLNNSLMIAYGDHSWPIGIHQNNIFNERGAWQENFVSSMIIIPRRGMDPEIKNHETIIETPSHLDILPTLLDMMNVTGFKSYGSPFLDKDLNAKKRRNDCLLSVQPYSEGYIVIIIGVDKYLYNLSQETVIKYDLAKDPQENNPIVQKAEISSFKKQLKSCLQ